VLIRTFLSLGYKKYSYQKLLLYDCSFFIAARLLEWVLIVQGCQFFADCFLKGKCLVIYSLWGCQIGLYIQ